ncbi:O-antigen ligase family protein [Luteolibacter sp. AS25]|uniref:O-antigen ligase family protein n=1 Tax=Luteolibacter sp. AS25 TaxID=3135776 RepID=UPI00398A8227
MNSNKLLSFIIPVVAIIFGIWLIGETSALPERLQIFALVAVFVLALIYLIKRSVPFDFKLIALLIVGYAFAGKGFAYISPAEPFYIGEIVFCCAGLGYIMRLYKGAKIFPTFSHVMIITWMIVVGLYLTSGYDRFGLVAIRDSAIGYYAAFALFGYTLFRHNDLDHIFGIILKIAIFAAWIGSAVYAALGQAGQFGLLEAASVIFSPHPDAYLPLVAAGGIYYLLIGIQQKKLHLAGLGMILLFALIGAKTAGIFSFVLVGGHCILVGKRKDLFLSMGLIITILMLVVGILIAAGVIESGHMLEDNEHLEAFGAGATTSGTTDWRIAWWTIVFEDAMAINPVFGMGLGSDITSSFLEQYMRMDIHSVDAATYARYPHNVFFTVIGRLGIAGVTLFMFMVFTLYRTCAKVTRAAIAARDEADRTALLAMLIFLAGLANGFVQATYEVPYGAITNWFCLGYVIAYYQNQRQLRRASAPALHAFGRNNHVTQPQNPVL